MFFFYVIKDVCVVVSFDEMIEKVMVFVVNGLIEVVGMDFEILVDVWVVDGIGKMFYFGMINVFSDFGIKVFE